MRENREQINGGKAKAEEAEGAEEEEVEVTSLVQLDDNCNRIPVGSLAGYLRLSLEYSSENPIFQHDLSLA